MAHENESPVWIPDDLLKKIAFLAKTRRGITIKKYVTEVLEEDYKKNMDGMDSEIKEVFGDSISVKDVLDKLGIQFGE